MSDTPEQQDNTPTGDNDTTPSQAQNSDSHMIPKSRFDEVNTQRRQLEQRLAELEQKQQRQQEQELEEQEKWRELAEQRQREIEDLKSAQEQATTYRQRLEENNQARIERVPENKRHLIPEYDDPVKLSAYLDRAIDDLAAPAKPSAPSLDGSSGISSNEKPLPANIESMAQQVQSQYGRDINMERLAERVRKANND